MPILKRQFIHEELAQGNTLTLSHHNDYNGTIQKININNTTVYQGYNEMFFEDLFTLLNETGLLESYEIINNTENESYYQQTMTIFGCKFCVWLNDNVFAMVKDNIVMSTTNTLDSYLDAWVSYGTPVPLNNYTITVNYNTTFIDVYVNSGTAEVLPLFTLMKCHSVDNIYDFVYASKNCNGVSYCSNDKKLGEIPTITWDTTYYNSSGFTNALSIISSLTYYYHHIYYCDKHQNQTVLSNKILNFAGQNTIVCKHTTLTGNAITVPYHLFMRYRNSEVFNITFNGMKIMKPNACQFNIVFDDIGEILVGPQDVKVLCPGRYYTIDEDEYIVPGCDEIVRGIKNATEELYSINSLRFFLKL